MQANNMRGHTEQNGPPSMSSLREHLDRPPRTKMNQSILELASLMDSIQIADPHTDALDRLRSVTEAADLVACLKTAADQINPQDNIYTRYNS